MGRLQAARILELEAALKESRKLCATYALAVAVMLAERGLGTLEEFASNNSAIEALARAEFTRLLPTIKQEPTT